MAPTAVDESLGAHPDPFALKTRNINGNGQAKHIIDPEVLSRPNLALWVTKDHNIYQKEEPFPTCPPDSCVIHVVSTGSGGIAEQ
jgi:L-iditol 2-dehydrogenase